MKRFFFFLIFVWVGIASCNVVYNMVKSVSEVKEWAFLSDSQRRQKAFGNQYDFTQVIAAHTPQNGTILLYTTDTLLPLLSRYYLYPRIITVTQDKEKFLSMANAKRFQFVAEYKSSLKVTGYKQIASFFEKNSRNVGYLFEIPKLPLSSKRAHGRCHSASSG